MNFEINTKRLKLKPPTLDNDAELFDLMSMYVDTTYLNWLPHLEIATTTEVIENLNESQNQGKSYHWCIFHEDKIIGLISLIDVKRQIRTWTLNRAELSYWIAKPYTCKGYATEASQVIVDFGFNQLGLYKIVIAHANGNRESAKICVKLDFEKYAYEKYAFIKDNSWHDLVWYEKFTPYL